MILDKISAVEKKFWESMKISTPLQEMLLPVSEQDLCQRHLKAIPEKIKIEQQLDGIRKQLDISDELYPKVASMQANYLINLTSSYFVTGNPKLSTDSIEQLLRCKNFMEPFKLKPECVMYYNKCTMMLSDIYNINQNTKEALQTFENAAEDYEKYMRSVRTKPWGFSEIFGSPNSAESIETEGTIHEKNTKIILKHGIQLLKDSNEENCSEELFFNGLYLKIAHAFLEKHYFRQSKHVIVNCYVLIK